MIDVKFNEAMKPLVQAMVNAASNPPAHESVGNMRRVIAAAVVEALGIPAQMVADKNFRAQLLLLVDACKTDQDTTPGVVDRARDVLERVFYWLGMGDEGPEASLPLPDEVSSDKGISDLLEQVRVAARGLGGLQEEDENEGGALPPIRADEPESITEPGVPSFSDGDDPMRTSDEEASHIPDPPACGAPTDNAM